MNQTRAAARVATVLLVAFALVIYAAPASSLVVDNSRRHHTTTVTTTVVKTSVSTVVSYAGPGPKFSSVTITLTSDKTAVNKVSGPCENITGYVYWNIGPLPPTVMWYVVAYPDGTNSTKVPLALGPAYTQYIDDPPTPIGAEYTASPFDANVCGLQPALNVVTLYADDPTNLFWVQVFLNVT